MKSEKSTRRRKAAPKKAAPNLGGRPVYEPTLADRRTVAHMAAAGIPHIEIASCIGAKGIHEQTLRKHFPVELRTSRHTVTALAVATVVKGIKSGEAWACNLWLKTRGGFKETQAHQFVDQEGKDRPFMLSDADRLIAEADDADGLS